MKVLYIGHYKEASGWGQAARDYILALDSVGIDVYPQSLNLGNSNAELPTRLVELEQKPLTKCDVCIQHVLPHYMKYDSCFRKNVGLFVAETENIGLTSWPSHLNLMDEVWVPCNSIVKNAKLNDINKSVHLVPHTFDTSIYQQNYEKLNLPISNKFVFYFIGEMNKRKHLSALVQAFHIEFAPEEPVELLLKVNKFNLSSDVLAEELKGFCNQIKDNLRLYKDPSRYKAEIIITLHIDKKDLLRLHKTCDCFVMPSYGEGFCIPAWEAMAMGNIVIASATGAMLDYIDSERNGFLVSGNMEPVFGQTETFEEFGTAREQWFNISISDLRKTMRRVYELSNDRKEKIKMEAKTSALQYDYKYVGNKMKELLSV